MIYLEGYVSLQKGYMGRYEDVYDVSEGVYDTVEGYLCFTWRIYDTSEGVIGKCDAVYDLAGGVYGTSKRLYGTIERTMFFFCFFMEGNMVLLTYLKGLRHFKILWVCITYVQGFLKLRKGYIGQ